MHWRFEPGPCVPPQAKALSVAPDLIHNGPPAGLCDDGQPDSATTFQGVCDVIEQALLLCNTPACPFGVGCVHLGTMRAKAVRVVWPGGPIGAPPVRTDALEAHTLAHHALVDGRPRRPPSALVIRVNDCVMVVVVEVNRSEVTSPTPRETTRGGAVRPSHPRMHLSPNPDTPTQGQLELDEMDEPMNSFVFGEKDELFRYRMVGEHATQSGEGPWLAKCPRHVKLCIAPASMCVAFPAARKQQLARRLDESSGGCAQRHPQPLRVQPNALLAAAAGNRTPRLQMSVSLGARLLRCRDACAFVQRNLQALFETGSTRAISPT